MMDKAKRKRLEMNGWKIGNAADFLDLNREDVEYIEMKLELSQSLKEQRIAKNMTQTDLAKQLHSSQSRIAKMEASDPGVSIDLLMRSLLSLGATKQELARIISRTDQTAVA